jgi:hypothetical protein
VHKLHAHVNGETDGQEPDKTRHEKVQNTNVFMVCGHKPTGKKPAVVFMVLLVDGCVYHVALPAIDGNFYKVNGLTL